MTSVVYGNGNLPVALTSFVGRRRDIAEIRRLLGTTRLLTLTGVGGVGKTRLALEVATEARKAFPDGTWLVDLAPVQHPAAVASTAASAVGIADLGVLPTLDQLARHLAGRRALVVLDNCEHLVDACAELAGTLLSAGPGLRVLATSRRTLGIVGEYVYTLAPLVPDEAVELLQDRAVAVRPEFRITDASWGAATRLCDELDGLPLAIELAASRLRTLSLQQMLDRLEDRFALLTGGNSIGPPHQRTLRALIDWSYELCSPAERLLWNRLSVFADGFDLHTAEGVCSGDGIATPEVLDLLDRLVSQSVVLITEAEGQPRYRLLETIRRYGRERLVGRGEEQGLQRRHRDYFLSLAESIADRWWGPGQVDGLARLRADHRNLLVALRFDNDPQATLRLAAALRYHWCLGGFLGEGRRQLDRVLAAAPQPTGARSRALWVAAWVALLQGDHATADQWLAEAAELGERHADPVATAHVTSLSAMALMFRGRLAEAVGLYERAVVALTSAEGEAASLFVRFQLAVVLTQLGDSRAAEAGRRTVAIAEAHGERMGRAFGLWALGYDAWTRGDCRGAVALTRDGLEIERGFNEPLGAGLMLELLAWVTASLGEHEQAGFLLGAARGLWLDMGTGISAFGPSAVAYHEQCEESIVRCLGRAEYERALASGAGHDTPGRAIDFALGVTTPSAPVAAPNPLTPREREVAALVAKGMSSRQIAAALVISQRTVDGHLENIRAKLGFGSRAQIAAWWAVNEAKTS
ncbi:ATP-binding protein [Streptomyces sp. NPDC051677]|uniref:ATP-binding protein n=1 Tax=Streptomyces sp. NPDC051677 TaxID=3365669 RepID=UPI0037D4ACDD